MNYNLITVLGPTATGKTRLAALLADHFNGEIISADSRQVYRNMNIGTGKDYQEYIVNDKTITFHLIDVLEPSEEFNVFLFKELFDKAFSEITLRGKTPILCGGTGLYMSSVLRNYKLIPANKILKEDLEKLPYNELKLLYLSLNKNPHNTTDLSDKNRLINSLIILQSESNNHVSTDYLRSINIGINPGRNEIKNRITSRLKSRLESGMIDEVKLLMQYGVKYEKMMFFGLEYKYIAQYLNRELNYNDMFQKLNSAIHAFSKRQMTWYRKMEKGGVIINWLESNDFNSAKLLIEDLGFRSS